MNSKYESKHSVIVEATIGSGTIIRDQVNLYKCEIGNNCKIKPNVFIPTGVRIEDDVFIGPNVTFTNDKYPRAKGEWKLAHTIVERGASIGAHSVILPGVRIGRNAMIGAGSVVTKDIPANVLVYGNPCRFAGKNSRTRRTLLSEEK